MGFICWVKAKKNRWIKNIKTSWKMSKVKEIINFVFKKMNFVRKKPFYLRKKVRCAKEKAYAVTTRRKGWKFKKKTDKSNRIEHFELNRNLFQTRSRITSPRIQNKFKCLFEMWVIFHSIHSQTLLTLNSVLKWNKWCEFRDKISLK